MRVQTLRQQLTRSALLTTQVALLLSAGSLLVYEYEWSTYRQVWVDDLQTQADLIAHASAAALVFSDPKGAQENLALLRQKPRIRAALILDAQGRRFASYTADEQVAWPPGPPRFPHGPEHRFAGATVVLGHPVVHDGERVGAVLLLAQHDVWSRLATYAAIEAGVTAAALMLATAVFGGLQQRVTQPLTSVTRVAQEGMARREGRGACFTPNLQVARLNATQYAVSACGFNNAIGNKLLVLVDGRIVYSPLFSGVFWDGQDVVLDDVERIEVISGPGGTLWGANAVNGVINVVTRDAAQTHGTLLAATGGRAAAAATGNCRLMWTTSGARTARCSSCTRAPWRCSSTTRSRPPRTISCSCRRRGGCNGAICSCRTSCAWTMRCTWPAA